MFPAPGSLHGYDWLVKSAGGMRPKTPAPDPEPLHSEPPATPVESEKPKPTVTLKDLKWEKATGAFEAESRITVSGELSDALKHVTRVQFTLFALIGNGRREKFRSQEGHLKDGVAETAFELPHSPGEDGKSEPEGKFLCVAKHRDSVELESAAHTAKEMPRLVLELEDEGAWKHSEFVFRLFSPAPKSDVRLKVAEGKSEGGKLILRFTALDSAAKYTLEIQDGEGMIRQQVFKESAYGEWEKKLQKEISGTKAVST